MNFQSKLRSFLYVPALLVVHGLLLFIACNYPPKTKPSNTTPATYTVTLSNSGGAFTVTGATNVTITLPDGQIVFPCTGNPPIDTTVTNPPLDTTNGREFVFGANTNHWQPKDKQAMLPSVRYYLPIGWVYTPLGFYGQPMKQAQSQFLGVDDYLTFLKSKNVEPLLCLMQSPDWLNGHNSFGMNTNDYPPLRPGLDKEKPASYSEVSGIYGAFAKRYGSKTWPVGSYRVDPAPPRWTGDEKQAYKSGLGLVKYIETGNERDVWWKIGTAESDQYMTAKQHAAFQIAVYDSIKAADPNIIVVMAGLTNYDLKYLMEMKAVFDAMGRRFPCDVINVHHYANSGNLPGVHPPTWWTNEACAPELDKDIVTLSNIVTFAKSIGLPVWVTEYGYDSNQGSQMSPKLFPGVTSEQLQADWNVRTALEQVRLGVSRSYMFSMADEPNASNGLFQSCGLLRGENVGFTEKPAFGKFVDMCNQLRGFKYLADQSTAKTRVLKFKHPDGRIKLAYWSPTASNATFTETVGGTSVTVKETVQFSIISNNVKPI